ncbi:MAG: DUF3014 domain-containing protein [Acidobacteriota bacterium]
MPEMDDLQLDPMPEPLGSGYEPPQEPRPIWPWVAAVAVVVALSALGVWYWRLPAEAPAQRTAAVTEAPTPAEPREPLGPSVETLDLPPLDLTDSLVRDLLRQLSSRPEVATWLATDGLIRNFAVCVDNIAEGKSPARHLRALAPKGSFVVATRGALVQIDARSFQRYDSLADAVASFDAAGLAKLYSSLKPRLADAFRDLGHPDGDIDRGVERAIVHLLQTPAVPPDTALREAVLSYRYADDRVENLSDAQKQMARMGPRNQELVQDKLREIAVTLGIPRERLPAATRLLVHRAGRGPYRNRVPGR